MVIYFIFGCNIDSFVGYCEEGDGVEAIDSGEGENRPSTPPPSPPSSTSPPGIKNSTPIMSSFQSLSNLFPSFPSLSTYLEGNLGDLPSGSSASEDLNNSVFSDPFSKLISDNNPNLNASSGLSNPLNSSITEVPIQDISEYNSANMSMDSDSGVNLDDTQTNMHKLFTDYSANNLVDSFSSNNISMDNSTISSHDDSIVNIDVSSSSSNNSVVSIMDVSSNTSSDDVISITNVSSGSDSPFDHMN